MTGWKTWSTDVCKTGTWLSNYRICLSCSTCRWIRCGKGKCNISTSGSWSLIRSIIITRLWQFQIRSLITRGNSRIIISRACLRISGKTRMLRMLCYCAVHCIWTGEITRKRSRISVLYWSESRIICLLWWIWQVPVPECTITSSR